MSRTGHIAFALGGLAGNNAFGAGFLEAALDQGVEPKMISCTSGQIFWTSKYLQCRSTGGSLREVLREEIDKVATTHNVNIDLAAVALLGRPGVFRPAYFEYLSDLMGNGLIALQRLATKGTDAFLLQEALETLPGRVLVPLFADDFFSAMSTTLNASDIGIAFNSYNPKDGKEYVHLNAAARELRTRKSQREGAYAKDQPSRYRERTTYADITPDTVRDGLWIYQYGFDQQRNFLDGAYFRQIMLSELVYASDIFVARPINHRWLGSLPTSQIGIEDLKTEVGFNGSYAGERNQIELINALLEGGDLSERKYHRINLHEIEIAQQRGFLDYVFEREEVFNAAYEHAQRAFHRHTQ